MRRETSRVSFLMCPFCVRVLVPSLPTHQRALFRRCSSRAGAGVSRREKSRPLREEGRNGGWSSGSGWRLLAHPLRHPREKPTIRLAIEELAQAIQAARH
jgi:hypothetical protein